MNKNENTKIKNKRLLAIDCSLRLTGAALLEDGHIVSSETRDLGRRQSAELPLMTEHLLKDAGWTWDSLDLTAVANGPGYFTGIRVGAAYASGLAYGLGVRIVPVSSLEMLAASCEININEAPVLAVVYAGHGFVYAASFGDAVPPLEQGEYSGEEIARWLSRHQETLVLSDDPARAAGALGPDIRPDIPMRAVRPDVSRLAWLAWERRDSAILPSELRAAYCRAPGIGQREPDPQADKRG